MTALLFRSVGRITLGKRTPSRGKRYGATSRIRRYHVEITRMDWPRAVPHTGVSEVDPARLGWDSYTAEKVEGSAREDTGSTWGGAVPWKNTHVGSPRGNHYTRAPSPAQGLTLGNVRVLDLASGAPPHLTAEGAGGTSTGFAVGNWTEKQQGARIRSVEGNGAASVIDTERVPVLLAIRDKYTGGHWLYTEIVKPRKRIRCRPAGSFTNVCYWGASRQSPRGSNASRRVCSHTKGAR